MAHFYKKCLYTVGHRLIVDQFKVTRRDDESTNLISLRRRDQVMSRRMSMSMRQSQISRTTSNLLSSCYVPHTKGGCHSRAKLDRLDDVARKFSVKQRRSLP